MSEETKQEKAIKQTQEKIDLVGIDAFLKPAGRQYKVYHIEDFGNVRLQSLTDREYRDATSFALTSTGLDKKKQATVNARLIVKSVVDDDGKPFLTESHVTNLRDQSPGIIEALTKAINEFNGLDREVSGLGN